MIPEWLDGEAWEAWVEMRKENRWKLTERAKKMWLEDLEAWHKAGYDTSYILKESTKKNWRGLFVNEGTPRTRQQRTKAVYSADDLEYFRKNFPDHPALQGRAN